jgi:hypothetical protein
MMIPVSVVVALSALVWVFFHRRARQATTITINDVKGQSNGNHQEESQHHSHRPLALVTSNKVARYDGPSMTKDDVPLYVPAVMPPDWNAQSYKEEATDVANSIGVMKAPVSLAVVSEEVDLSCGASSGDPGYATKLAATLIARGVEPAVINGYTTGDPKTDEAILQAQIDATSGVPTTLSGESAASADLSLGSGALSGFVTTSFMVSPKFTGSLAGPDTTEDN